MKRKTKAQRIAAQKKALYQRVYDIACGACGRVLDNDDDNWLTSEELARFIPVLQQNFGADDMTFLWSLHNLGHFETPTTAADFLYEYGVRA